MGWAKAWVRGVGRSVGTTVTVTLTGIVNDVLGCHLSLQGPGAPPPGRAPRRHGSAPPPPAGQGEARGLPAARNRVISGAGGTISRDTKGVASNEDGNSEWSFCGNVCNISKVPRGRGRVALTEPRRRGRGPAAPGGGLWHYGTPANPNLQS